MASCYLFQVVKFPRLVPQLIEGDNLLRMTENT